MNSKRIIRICFLANLCILAGLTVTQLVLSNELVKMSGVLGDVEAEIVDYSQKNEILEQKTASASALYTVEMKAEELGFMPTTKTIVMSPNELPVAVLNR